VAEIHNTYRQSNREKKYEQAKSMNRRRWLISTEKRRRGGSDPPTGRATGSDDGEEEVNAVNGGKEGGNPSKFTPSCGGRTPEHARIRGSIGRARPEKGARFCMSGIFLFVNLFNLKF
jgi:hypothetical protein